MTSEKFVVKAQNGVPVFLQDIGTLKYGNLERKGILGYTDRQRNYSESVEGIVLLLRGQNPSQVLEKIHKAVDDLNNGILPPGVKIHPFLDRTDLVKNTLTTVSHTLIEGIVLVIIVLIVFLGSWRGALLVAITIPLSLLFAFILMYFTDIPANLLSLGTIDFGIIVDGAIVMLETILKEREKNSKEILKEKTVIQRVIEVAKRIFLSTIIIITAYLPLFAFERVEKKLFTPMAFTVDYSLLGALSVVLLLIPGLAYVIYHKPQKIYHNKWLEKISIAYGKKIEKTMQAPKRVIIPVIIVLISSGILFYTVEKNFYRNLMKVLYGFRYSCPLAFP